MALDAAAIALGEFVFVFRDGGEETGSGPAFLIGLFGEFGPYELDGRKTQFVEKDAKLGGIDGAVRLHATSHRQAGTDQGFIDIERHEVDLDLRQCGGIGREVGPQSGHVRQLPGLQSGGKLVGQFALAAALMGEREQIRHDAAGLALRHANQEREGRR